MFGNSSMTEWNKVLKCKDIQWQIYAVGTITQWKFIDRLPPQVMGFASYKGTTSCNEIDQGTPTFRKTCIRVLKLYPKPAVAQDLHKKLEISISLILIRFISQLFCNKSKTKPITRSHNHNKQPKRFQIYLQEGAVLSHAVINFDDLWPDQELHHQARCHNGGDSEFHDRSTARRHDNTHPIERICARRGVYSIEGELAADQEDEERYHRVDHLFSERNLPIGALNLREESQERANEMQHPESPRHLPLQRRILENLADSIADRKSSSGKSSEMRRLLIQASANLRERKKTLTNPE